MAETFEVIATTTLGSASNLVTFNSISQSYDDLFIVLGSVKTSANNDSIAMYFNNDTASNYGRSGYYADGSGNGSSASQTGFSNTTLAGSSAWIDQSAFSTTYEGQSNIYIANYSSTTLNKTYLIRSGCGAFGYFEGNEFCWYSTSAINRIDFKVQITDTMSVGTTITIYGIKAA